MICVEHYDVRTFTHQDSILQLMLNAMPIQDDCNEVAVVLKSLLLLLKHRDPSVLKYKVGSTAIQQQLKLQFCVVLPLMRLSKFTSGVYLPSSYPFIVFDVLLLLAGHGNSQGATDVTDKIH